MHKSLLKLISEVHARISHKVGINRLISSILYQQSREGKTDSFFQAFSLCCCYRLSYGVQFYEHESAKKACKKAGILCKVLPKIFIARLVIRNQPAISGYS